MSAVRIKAAARSQRAWVRYWPDSPADRHRGLEILASSTDSLLTAIRSSLSAMGKLLAFAEAAEVGEEDFINLGWLLAGLGELGIELQKVRDMAEENIRWLREDGAERTPQKTKAQKTREMATEA